MAAGYRIGIDVGGTFTDFLVVDPDGSLTQSKSFTTPQDQSIGVLEGLDRVAADRELSLRELLGRTDLIVHGTTTADNTMIELSGAKTGLLVTAGARDEIELRRGWKEDIWDPTAPPPPQIVPRRYRLPVDGRLDEQRSENGYKHELLVMQSSGGIATAESALQRPIATLASGPAGGVMGACMVARESGVENFISVDMGGTSYDVCLVRGAEPTIKSFWNWVHRYLIALPMVDVVSMGSGGGSIARVPAGGLQIGPDSAGSDPGPVCYGRGGTEPTVTDANLVLGYLNPDYFAGGEFPLKADGIVELIEEKVGQPLGLDGIEAAWGIHRLVNADMNNAIVRVSAERGLDPREFALVVFGGNGAVHAMHQADDLGISRVLIPKAAPAFSALGLLVADYLVEKVRASLVSTKEAESEKLEATFRELEETAESELVEAGLPTRRFAHQRFAQC